MKRTINWFSVLPALVIPVCLGLVLYLGLMAAIDKSWITDEMTLRYLIGHPVSKVTVAMFFIGSASLFLIGLDVFQQFRHSNSIELNYVPSSNKLSETNEAQQTPEERATLLGRSLMKNYENCQDHFLFQRLASILQSIHQNGTTFQVNEELKYLSDVDIDQQPQRYSLVQILIWATPMLGFLGTVLGISQALGSISIGPENDFQNMMDGLKTNLNVAFDTTGLALILSMVMMFGQFFVERFETQLLRMVDHRAHTEIAAQFDLSSDKGQESGNALESNLIATMEAATERQTELWRESLDWAGSTVSQAIQDSQNKFDSRLVATIDDSLQGLAFNLGESISRADQSMSHRWEQWQVMLSENARHVAKNQTAFVEQTQAVCRMLEQAAQHSSQSTQEISAQLSLQTREMSVQLQSVTNELRNDTFAAMLGELLTTRSLANKGLLSEQSDFVGRETGSQPSVVEGKWISVSPAFLTNDEEWEQVILPFPSPKIYDIKPTSSDNSIAGGTAFDREPEVILPFLKQSA